MTFGTTSSGTFYYFNNKHQSIPMMNKTDSGLRPYYLTHEFTIHDAPFDDEIVIAIGGASSGRAHARTGDRYQDMKEMGIEPK